MRACLPFFVVAVALAVDCSGVFPWKADSAYDSGLKVTYEQKLFRAQWYANIGDVPNPDAQYEAWTYEGPCDAGTDSNFDPNKPAYDGPKMDCSAINPWSGSDTYANPGVQVSFKGVVWVSQTWSQSSPPEITSGGPWAPVGICIEGTEQQAATGSGLSPMIEAMVCTCCHGCAKISGNDVVCLDDAETCYFTECTKYNTFNEERCSDIVNNTKLLYYTGEIQGPMTAPWPKKLYAPYLDAGLYPFPKLSSIASDIEVKFFNLAFLVAANTPAISGCEAAWAAVLPIEQGPFAWDGDNGKNVYLYDEINAIRAMGGDVIVSFGGAANTELADADVCKQGDAVEKLVEAYSHAIDFLKLTHIDFDIEGQAIAKNNRETGWKNRFAAVKKLKEKYPDLHVWWTLPTLPAGLTDDGIAFITDMFTVDAPWDLINVMTMDYGDSACPSLQMGQCEREAIDNLAKNIYDAASATGKLSQFGFNSVQDVYPKIGSTPMIGLNDVITETYHFQDARDAMEAWKSKPLGLVSNWSLSRDQACPSGQGINAAVADCSSLPDQTEKFQFAKIFKSYTTY